MKTIVIAGAHSNVGKTILADSICSILEGSVHVKVGHGPRKEGLGNIYYPYGTPFETIVSGHGEARFLVIESGAVARQVRPDCLIFLTGGEPKEGAGEIMEKADFVRGKAPRSGKIEELASSLGLPASTVGEIARLVTGVRQGSETSDG